jgi:hypothetical protein
VLRRQHASDGKQVADRNRSDRSTTRPELPRARINQSLTYHSTSHAVPYRKSVTFLIKKLPRSRWQHVKTNHHYPQCPLTFGTVPSRFGLLLYPRFEVLDVLGLIEALNVLTRYTQFSLSIISTTLDTVPSMTTDNPFQQNVVPTHTVRNSPSLNVLLVPGGLGSGEGHG